MSVKADGSPNDYVPWWQKHRLRRTLFYPLLSINPKYNQWQREHSSAYHAADIQTSKKLVESFRSTSEDVVVPEKLLDDLLASIHYWVLQDKDFQNMCVSKPPKVVVIKGGTGSGKTSIVHAIACKAVDDGAELNKAVWFEQVSAYNIFNKWLGASERAMADTFDTAFQRPTILFFDEAQSLFSGEEVDKGDSGAQAYRSTQATFLEKVNELVERPCPTILILATNEFGNLNEAVKRRGSSGTFDLDKLVDRSVLLAIVKKKLARHKLSLDADEVLKTIESKLISIGHQTLTPADINTAFEIVLNRRFKDIKTSYLHRLEQKVTGTPEITILDFKDISEIKEYAEEKRSTEMKRIVQRIKPSVRLEDVGGIDDIKYELVKDIQIALDYERTIAQGATPVRGILLYGVAGTGKTYLAQAIANNLNATLYMLHGSQIIKPWAGESSKIISQMFDDARKTAPSIILIDEIDAITLNRDAGGHLDIVTTLLSEMGGMKPMHGIVVIGTTNKPQLIDPAFLRAGRFDRQVEIQPPRNDEERKAIIAIHLQRCRNLAPEVTPQAVLDLLGKRVWVPARIERIVSDAIALRAKELEAIHAKQPELWSNELARITKLGFKPEDITEDGSNYPLKLFHFYEAITISRKASNDEAISEFVASVRGNQPADAIGKVYGLAALSGESGLPIEGMVGTLECVINPKGTGSVKVTGSEVAASVQASAEQGRIFLMQALDWQFKDADLYIEMITPLKGIDVPQGHQAPLSGPSAGAAMAVAMASAILKIPVKADTVITGGITEHGEIIMVGGLDFKGTGKFMAAIDTEGIKQIVIPRANYTKLEAGDIEYFQRVGLTIKPADTFWDVFEAATGVNKTKVLMGLGIMDMNEVDLV